MTFLKRYLIPRLIQYVLVIWLGITVVFLIPRLTPNDPVMTMIGMMRARGSTLEPGAMDGIIRDLTEMYGLEGSWLDQYWAFWGRLFRGDFGVSFFQFPTRVNQLIATAMPWTLGLLLTTTVISWILGNIIGGLAGYYSRKGLVADPGCHRHGDPPAALLHLRLRVAPASCLCRALVPGYRRGVIGSHTHLHLGLYQRCPLAFVLACPLAKHPGRGSQRSKP